jgi:tetratricopeptide (TPR) repeat protein
MPRWFGRQDSEPQYRQLISEGKHYLENGDLETAQKCFEGALTLARSLWRDSPLNWLESLSGLGAVVHQLGDTTRSTELAIETLHLAERALGNNHPQTAAARNNAIVCLEDTGRYREAVPLLERALAAPLKNEERHKTLLELARMHQACGAFYPAKQVAERALSMCDADGELEKLRDDALNQIGIAELWGGAPERALDAFLEAFRLRAKDGKPGDPMFALNVGSALRGLQRHDEAAEWISRAFALRRTEHEEGVLAAIFVAARAELEEAQGALQRAVDSYRWSFETFEKHLPSFHPRVVRAGVGLARTLRAHGLHEESRSLAKKIVAAITGHFPASYPWLLEATALARDD